jgi:hypothetical protein
VSGHVAVGSDGYQRQRRDPRLALPQLVDQGGLRRSRARRTRPGERGGRDRADHLGVGLLFPPDQHRSTMGGHPPGAQPDYHADRGLPYYPPRALVRGWLEAAGFAITEEADADAYWHLLTRVPAARPG